MAPGPDNRLPELSGKLNSYGNLIMHNESGSGVILRGSQQGRNLLVATAGNNQLYGGRKGDGLDGGSGDDDYYFAEMHGQDVITDSGGENTLHFTAPGLRPEGIALSVEGNDLTIQAKGHHSNLVRVKKWQGTIKTIALGNAFRLKGSDIAALAETMAGFSAADKSGSSYAARVEEMIQRYWVAAPLY